MGKTDHQALFDMIRSVVHIVQQHGQHDFPADADDVTTVITLCGLTLCTRGRDACIMAHNIELSFEYFPLAAANDDAAQRQPYGGMACGALQFTRGDVAVLAGWHGHLQRLDSSFDFSRKTALV